jgi:ribosomal protein L11 methyltransferase
VLQDEAMVKRLGGGYDLVLANIVADVIIRLAPRVESFLKAEGTFICSGIIDGREEETAAALKQAGLVIKDHMHEEEWNAYVCTL